MTDSNHQDDKTIILNLTDDAIVANTVSPISALGARQRLADRSRIVERGDVTNQIVAYPPCCLVIQLRKVAPCAIMQLYRPGQVRRSLHQACMSFPRRAEGAPWRFRRYSSRR